MTEDRISIVVLTHDRKWLLRDCLYSLLTQHYANDKIEIVVSDDGSRDGTREMVKQMQASHRRINNVYQPHRGIAAARNNGIAHATGDVVAIVADDYILDPTYASTIMQFFAERPAAQVVRFKMVAAGRDLGSRISHFYFDVSVTRRLTPDPPPPVHTWKERLARVWHKTPRFEETITTRHQLEAAGAAAFRRGVFESVGRFDESLQRAEDTDMTMRLRALGIDVYYYPFQEIRHQVQPVDAGHLYQVFPDRVQSLPALSEAWASARQSKPHEDAHVPRSAGRTRCVLARTPGRVDTEAPVLSAVHAPLRRGDGRGISRGFRLAATGTGEQGTERNNGREELRRTKTKTVER